MRADRPGTGGDQQPDSRPDAQGRDNAPLPDDGEHGPQQTHEELAQAVREDRAKNPRQVFARPSEGTNSDDDAADERKVDKWSDPETTSQRIAELKNEGHGPQRHVEVTDRGLQGRLGTAAHDANGEVILRPSDGHVKKQPGTRIDPESGTATDSESGQNHFCGNYATRFDDSADYCRADEVLRLRAAESGKLTQTATISDLFPGAGAKDRFTGYYQDPAQPENSDGTARFKTIDFDAGTVIAIYDLTDSGDLRLRTMYPDPDHHRNT